MIVRMGLKWYNLVLVLVVIMALTLVAPVAAIPATYAHIENWGWSGSPLVSPFANPTDVAVNSSGYVYVADTGSLPPFIMLFDPAGTSLKNFGDSQSINPAGGIAVNSSGYVYVADDDNEQEIRIYDPSGNYLGESSSGPYSTHVGGVAVNASGYLYVEDGGTGNILRSGPSGNYLTAFGSTPYNPLTPMDVAVNSTGFVYVVDEDSPYHVLIYDSMGTYVTSFDLDFTPRNGITIDSSGNVYIVDDDILQIQVLTSSGTPLTTFGPGLLDDPSGIAVDSSGRVFVTDEGGSVNPSPLVHVFIPSPTAAFMGTPSSGSAPLTVAFTDQSTGGPTMWNWSFGDGTWTNTTNAAARNPTHSYTSAGTWTVNLTVSNTAGTDSVSKTGYITVTPAGTTSSGSGDSSGDAGRSTSFAVTAPGTTAGGTMTFTVNEPLSVGGAGYTYAIATVSIVPSGTIGSTELTVTDVGASAQPPEGRTTAGIVAIEPVAVNPSMISSGTITFAVSTTWLSAHGLSPSNIVLMRNDGSGWSELPTTFVSQSGNADYFTATTPGFSYFAITTRLNNETSVSNTTVPATLAAGSTAVTSGLPTNVPTYALSATTPVPTRTTAAPAPVLASAGSFAFPVSTVALIGTGCVVLAGAGWWVRRWYIQRQNPTLFRKYN
jgi:PGF-pre-PGF domain-containing protein